MKKAEASEIQKGEIFLQYYTCDSHTDLIIGKRLTPSNEYMWITCEPIERYRQSKETYKIKSGNEKNLARECMNLAARSTVYGKVYLFKLTDEEIGKILIGQI